MYLKSVSTSPSVHLSFLCTLYICSPPLSPLVSFHYLNSSRLQVICHPSFLLWSRSFPRAQTHSSRPRHPFLINNRLLSGDFYSFVFLFLLPKPSSCVCASPTIMVFWPLLVQTSEETLFERHGGGRAACQWAGGGLFSCFTGPPWTSDDVISY